MGQVSGSSQAILHRAVPVLRVFDVALAMAFYVGYLGCAVDWQDGDESVGPVYMQVSRGDMMIHLSSHHGDGTPGGVVLVQVDNINELHRELHSKGYAFMNPGIEPGPGEHMVTMIVLDPFSNIVRFFQRGFEP